MNDHKWETNYEWVPEVARLMKDGAAIYSFSNGEGLYWLDNHFYLNDIKVMSRLTWVKTNPRPNTLKKSYRQSTEMALFGCKGGWVGYFAKRTQTELLSHWILPAVGGRERTIHPTQKPTKLIRAWVENSSQPGDLILDPFCGSGTTGVACIQTGRRFIGIEIDPTYADIARARIAKAAEQARQLELI